MARAMLDDARITVLARDGTDIVKVSSPNRTIPAKLRRWLERTYPRCGVAGCGVDQRLQIDHIVGVTEHGPTCEENLWRLCVHHHKLKTFYGWKVVDEPGGRRLVAPDDPDPP
jgi:5-methylcytosine-specific restriction endonuclease McrA